MQKLMIEQATQQSKDSDDSADEGEADAVSQVTQQDLKQYSKKLQVRSDSFPLLSPLPDSLRLTHLSSTFSPTRTVYSTATMR